MQLFHEIFKKISKFYGPLKLKIENRLPRKHSNFPKEFIRRYIKN